MYDYNEACPISMAASVICERWTLQIIRELFFGSTRYSEIQKHIPNTKTSSGRQSHGIPPDSIG
jgi:DNA-binding HxlR family transcriptional regulator